MQLDWCLVGRVTRPQRSPILGIEFAFHRTHILSGALLAKGHLPIILHREGPGEGCGALVGLATAEVTGEHSANLRHDVRSLSAPCDRWSGVLIR